MLRIVLRSGKPNAEKNSQIIFFMLRCLAIGDPILHRVVQNLSRRELPFLIEVSCQEKSSEPAGLINRQRETCAAYRSNVASPDHSRAFALGGPISGGRESRLNVAAVFRSGATDRL